MVAAFTWECIGKRGPDWNYATENPRLPHPTITETPLLWTRRRPEGTLTAKTFTGDPTRQHVLQEGIEPSTVTPASQVVSQLSYGCDYLEIFTYRGNCLYVPIPTHTEPKATWSQKARPKYDTLPTEWSSLTVGECSALARKRGFTCGAQLSFTECPYLLIAKSDFPFKFIFPLPEPQNVKSFFQIFGRLSPKLSKILIPNFWFPPDTPKRVFGHPLYSVRMIGRLFTTYWTMAHSLSYTVKFESPQSHEAIKSYCVETVDPSPYWRTDSNFNIK